MEWPVPICSNWEQHSNGVHFFYWRESLIIINYISLRVAFCNQSYLSIDPSGRRLIVNTHLHPTAPFPLVFCISPMCCFFLKLPFPSALPLASVCVSKLLPQYKESPHLHIRCIRWPQMRGQCISFNFTMEYLSFLPMILRLYLFGGTPLLGLGGSLYPSIPSLISSCSKLQISDSFCSSESSSISVSQG